MSSWNSRGIRLDRNTFTTYFAEFTATTAVDLPCGVNVKFAKQWNCGSLVKCIVQFSGPQKWDAARLLLCSIQQRDVKFIIRPVGVMAEELDHVQRVAIIDEMDRLYPVLSVFGGHEPPVASVNGMLPSHPYLQREARMHIHPFTKRSRSEDRPDEVERVIRMSAGDVAVAANRVFIAENPFVRHPPSDVTSLPETQLMSVVTDVDDDVEELPRFIPYDREDADVEVVVQPVADVITVSSTQSI